jgi:hypothetical protein
LLEVAALAASAPAVLAGAAITATCRRTRSAASSGRRSICSAPAVVDRHVLALDIARLFEALAKGTQALGNRLGRSDFEKSDHRHRRLLRARRERPRRRATDERDEFAPLHSITSSARSRMEVGMVRPTVLAVLRFTTSWNWVGRSIGRSAGLRPCSTLPIITPL